MIRRTRSTAPVIPDKHAAHQHLRRLRRRRTDDTHTSWHRVSVRTTPDHRSSAPRSRPPVPGSRLPWAFDTRSASATIPSTRFGRRCRREPVAWHHRSRLQLHPICAQSTSYTDELLCMANAPSDWPQRPAFDLRRTSVEESANEWSWWTEPTGSVDWVQLTQRPDWSLTTRTFFIDFSVALFLLLYFVGLYA